MCGRAFDGRFLFSWPNHQIGVMGGEQAANTLVEVKRRQLEATCETPDEKSLMALREKTLSAYLEQTSAYYATSEIWDDGIIDPAETRNVLGIAITASMNALFSGAGPPDASRYGVFRF
jgi:3-methylcrotonyl-CoA carboxylase beta subunit